MLVILYSLLMFRMSGCTDVETSERMTVAVGQRVKLMCPLSGIGTFFWVGLVSGGFPKILAKTDRLEAFDHRRMEIKREDQSLVLYIRRAELSDTAVYYCVTTRTPNLTFLKGIHLTVEAGHPPEALVTARPAPPEDTVTLRCSVLPGAQNPTCPADERVLCFHADPLPSLNSTRRNKSENDSLNVTEKKCLYRAFKNLSSSDARAYFCSVASCGEKLSKNESKLDTRVDKTVLHLLSAVLAISLVVIAILFYIIVRQKKTWYRSCDDATELQTNSPVGTLQTDEDDLVYSAVSFARVDDKTELKRTRSTEEESVYSNIKAPRPD